MKLWNFTLNLAILFSVALFFSSCESSKIAFGNSYYFKQTPKKTNEDLLTTKASNPENLQVEVEPQKTDTETAYASKKAVAEEKSIQERIEKVEQKMEKIKTLREQEKSKTEQGISLSKAEEKALRKEKKAEQKELKKEIKALAKEYRKAPEEVKVQQAVSGNTRTGIILGAVGLILLIIGGPVLYTVGAILLVVGLVLILIDVL